MVKTLILILIFLSAKLSMAQLLPGEEKKIESHGLYLGVAGKGARMADATGIEVGVRIGGEVIKNLSVGGGLYTLISQNINIHIPENPTRAPFLRLGYGGPEVDYSLTFLDNFSYSVGLLAAVANANYSGSPSIDVANDPSGTWFLLFEISTGLNYQFFPDFWAGPAIGYRKTAAVNYKGLNNNNLSGMVIAINIKFKGF